MFEEKKLQRQPKQLSRQSYLQQQNTLKAFERVRMRILENGALSFHPIKIHPNHTLAEIVRHRNSVGRENPGSSPPDMPKVTTKKSCLTTTSDLKTLIGTLKGLIVSP